MFDVSDCTGVCYLIVVLCICLRLYFIERNVSEILRLTRNSAEGIGDIKKEISRSEPFDFSSMLNANESANLSGEASAKPVKVDGQ